MPSRLLQLLPAGTTLAGRDLHPLKNRAFPRHTAPEPHGLAVRDRCARLTPPSRPPHPTSHVRDDRETPLLWRRDGGSKAQISVKRKWNIFARGLDRGDQVEMARETGTKKIGVAMAWPRTRWIARGRHSPTGESELRGHSKALESWYAWKCHLIPFHLSNCIH